MNAQTRKLILGQKQDGTPTNTEKDGMKSSAKKTRSEAMKLKEEMLKKMADKPVVLLRALKDGRYRVI